MVCPQRKSQEQSLSVVFYFTERQRERGGPPAGKIDVAPGKWGSGPQRLVVEVVPPGRKGEVCPPGRKGEVAPNRLVGEAGPPGREGKVAPHRLLGEVCPQAGRGKWPPTGW